MHILFVTSNGGHLDQLARLRPWWSQHERTWVTFDTPDARSVLSAEPHVVDAFYPTTRNAGNAVRNLGLAWRVLRDVRPDIVVSTGAGVAVPFFVLARLHGIATVYLEVYDRIDSATLTGRLVGPFTDALLLQWEEQRVLYPQGRVVGPVYG
jgi:UDP-N-acetylglucosamine:LPS N-acetylglucosamine transferase